MSSAPDWRRTHTAGELRKEHVGATVTLNGWVHARRDHGGIYFVDLRDRWGITQIRLGEALLEGIKLGPQEVLSVTGEVVEREPGNVNRKRATGEVEVVASSLRSLGVSQVPPFELEDGIETSVETRLRYRFLDLRRPEMQRNLAYRSRFVGAMRNAFLRRDFVEVETPILTKATPEGARDYLVPSRVHPGSWYALPQSPQIFKQLLMVSGLERYFQVARCFRDEDQRADRQPEFTQLDMEMSFVEEEDVFGVWEGVLAETLREASGLELELPFPRLRWSEALERYGLDKPDTRYALELVAIDGWARECEFGVFRAAVAGGGRVMALRVPGAAEWSLKEIADLEKVAKGFGAQGLAWWKPGRETGAGPIARFAGGEAGGRLRELLAAREGDLCLFAAGKRAMVWRVLGELRVQVARRLRLVGPGSGAQGRWNFLWVTHFPMFELDAPSGRWFSSHHPFTAPEDWSLAGAPGDLASRAYDLVLNGVELGSGSVRIHRSDVQQQVFALLGIDPEEQRRKFGFLLDALAYGAPPHAGMAVGIDRLVALSLGLDSIRDVVAFPKTTSAYDLMCDAPSPVAPEQLAEVHVINTVPPEAPPQAAAPA